MPRLILCADDFAFSREVSETIAALAREGKLNATSCMTLMPGWMEDAALLRDLPRHVEIGLHLTLTGERPLTAMPMLAPDGMLPEIDPLARMASRGQVPLDEIAGEVAAQFDAFVAAMGRAPDFVDGHQHSHALPGIRDIVLFETANRAPKAWVRDCVDRVAAMLARPFSGKAIGSAYHSRGLRDAAARYGLRCNDSFAGHYDFASDYRNLFPRFLRKAGGMHLVMCHPGAGVRPGDAIAKARPREADALRKWSIADMAAAQGLAFPA
ncbi:ChbG/HpnK family deacetylase [Sphingomonas sp. RP10(2022)]|uniref:ChbG/HpnK family deacetylase n=1 Tax=Sphingomonas liriopis TaxID=2949094 RepID=A0A9X2HSK6_9SPHN|nr:ChbG/HpnK family deacetylase [Sphingomonas liriopis]MCP3733566.1 ChbG/HpnK family deacetylase [Sphingomonas liriopis]